MLGRGLYTRSTFLGLRFCDARHKPPEALEKANELSLILSAKQIAMHHCGTQFGS